MAVVLTTHGHTTTITHTVAMVMDMDTGLVFPTTITGDAIITGIVLMDMDIITTTYIHTLTTRVGTITTIGKHS